MSFAKLLARHPAATIVDPGDDEVVDGLLGTTSSTVATDVPVWVRDRRAAEVVYDEAGSIVVDADLYTETAIETGNVAVLADGRRYVIAGAAAHRQDRGGLHHLAYPARRIPASG